MTNKLSRAFAGTKLVSLAAVFTLLVPTVGGCSSTSKNPLIGSWKFTSTNNKFGASGCSSTFVFMEKQATITSPPSKVIPKGSVSTMAGTYVASPTLVTVMTNAAGHVNYTFTDKNHMYTEDAWGKCNFERTN